MSLDGGRFHESQFLFEGMEEGWVQGWMTFPKRPKRRWGPSSTNVNLVILPNDPPIARCHLIERLDREWCGQGMVQSPLL